MNVVVVIPTYNEAENIKKLIPALNDQFSKSTEFNWKVLIVDGNSPDNTAKIATELSLQYPFVRVIKEVEKGGLGKAYIYGFKHAINELSADVVVEMDADFQHNPNDLIPLVTELKNGFDYVIGSRFIKGGSIPADWAFYRKLLSYGGSIFSKIVLGIYSVNDFTSGFKASRVKGFVDKLDLDNALSSGFAYKIDLLYKMHKAGAKIKEVPITFGLRDRGDSKMENGNFLDSLKVVLKIRAMEHKNFVKFIIVGFSGLFVDTVLFNLLWIGMRSGYAALISGLIAMLTTFTLNNIWSFRDRKILGISKKTQSFALYVGSSLVPVLIRSQLVHFATDRFGETFIVSNIAFFIGIIFGLVWNFTVYSRIIWKKNID